MWGETVLKVLPVMENESTVLCKNVENVTDIIRRGNVNVDKHTGWMNVEVHKQVEKNIIQGIQCLWPTWCGQSQYHPGDQNKLSS